MRHARYAVVGLNCFLEVHLELPKKGRHRQTFKATTCFMCTHFAKYLHYMVVNDRTFANEHTSIHGVRQRNEIWRFDMIRCTEKPIPSAASEHRGSWVGFS